MTANNKILIGLIGLIALVVGATLNWPRVDDSVNTQALLNAELSAVSLPDDPELDEQYSAETIKSKLGKLTLVNFWASWCAPCREEMPVFEAMYNSAKKNGFQVIGVAIDNPDKARPMLDSMGITYPILYAERTGMEIMASSGNPQGLLPYSLLLDENGTMIDQVLGLINEQTIIAWLESAGIEHTQQPN